MYSKQLQLCTILSYKIQRDVSSIRNQNKNHVDEPNFYTKYLKI
jgi:hypothetical protein